MGAHTIGIDVGSQSIKGCLLDPDGDIVAVGRRACAMRHPASGWAEQDPAEWHTGLVSVVYEMLERAGVAGGDVGQLGLACQVDGVVPVDRDLRPLRDAIIWLDRRADAEAAALLADVGERELFELTGLNCNASHTAPKMMWLRDNEPDSYRETRWLPAVGGYLVGWLTGEVAVDHANASSTLLYDVGAAAWSERLLDAAGIEAEMLPALRDSTEVAGRLTPGAAERLGLTTECEVIVGTGDEHGAALAAGLLRPGLVADVTGTAEPVAAVAEELTLDDGGLVETHAHAVPGTLLVENPGFVSGGSTLWLAESVLRRPQADVFSLAAGAPPGSDGAIFLPTLSGAMAPRWNDAMRGAFAGLAMNHTDAHLARAVLEGCAYALRDIVDRLDSLGLAGEEVRVVGGGARSALWLQIKADVMNRPVRPVLAEEPTALGAAMLAALAGGCFSDFDDAVGCGVTLAPEPIVPDPERAARYEEGYAAYRRLFDGIEGEHRVSSNGHGGIDLAALRAQLAAAPDAERLRPLGLGRIVAGPDALLSLREVVADLLDGDVGPIAVLADATPMLRDRADLKATVRTMLEAEREVRPVVVGPEDGRAHADEATVAAARAAAEGASAIVTVASGTVADIGKTVAEELGGLPHLIVQTAASVNGFADDQSVMLRNGVKRTVPSRWPDVLLLDGAVLAEAPAPMNLAGLGDLVSMFTATPDWYLACEVGMDTEFSATAVELGRAHGEELLELAPALARNEAAAVVRLAEILAVSGISMGVAGRTAPSSGMEHTVSHMLEMAAERRGWGTALHGAKVGVATLIAALLWGRVRRRIAAGNLTLRIPEEAEMEERVRAAFDSLDPSGAMGEECWSDYGAKLRRWRERRPLAERFLSEWDRHEGPLGELLIDPVRLVEAMKTAGAPVRFTELDPAVDAETARWAIANCHLMRDRFTVADLACFAGAWEEGDVEEVLAEAAELGAGL